MTKDELNKRYFEWMCSLVYDNRYSNGLSYRKLLAYLNTIDFVYILPMDSNREEDGVDLRYRFGYECEYDNNTIALYLDDHGCSILEMMVALSMRCEETIMTNPDIGDRTGQWFWSMIVSLGLGSMTDDKFDYLYIDSVISRFINREYERNGKGGLFTLKKCDDDLRDVEIWCQMCWYLDEENPII
jgi:hypothetical protein